LLSTKKFNITNKHSRNQIWAKRAVAPPTISEKSSVDLLALEFFIIFAFISLNFGIFFSEFAIKSIVSINLHQYKPQNLSFYKFQGFSPPPEPKSWLRQC
jgi:hypothetical protein